MPQDLELTSEHDLILKNVESLRAADEKKANGKVITGTQNGSVHPVVISQNGALHLDPLSQKWHELECKNAELQCHIDFFEKAFETQQKSALAYTTAEIEKLLESNKKLESVFTSQKDQLPILHSLADELLELCETTVDENRVKGIVEATDQRWNHVRCSLKGQAKFLETKLNGFYGFDGNLKEFLLWLGKVETSLQDCDEVAQISQSTEKSDVGAFRKSVKSIISEMDGHVTILESLNATGNQMIMGLQSDRREPLQAQLDDVNQRWNKLRARCEAVEKFEIRQRQEKQSKAFNLLLQKLIELDVWLKCIEDDLASHTTIHSGNTDMTVLNGHAEHGRKLWQQIESRSSQVENYLRLGKQSLEKVSEQVNSDPEDMQLLSATVGEHLSQTQEKWLSIRHAIRQQQADISAAINRLEVIETKLAETKQLLDLLEGAKSKWLPVDDIIPTNLQAAVNQTRFFETELIPVKVKVNECNVAVKSSQNQNLSVSKKNTDELESINGRLNRLDSAVEERLNLLMIAALKKIDPTTQHQLASTVTYPWKRAVTDGKHVPYYINHDAETTHWNHPEMTSIIHTLDELNNIKFSAYRTAMKLRILQKRLSLGELSGAKLLELFEQERVGSSDGPMTVTDIVKYLTTAFSDVKTDDSKFNASLAIDLVLNWLLNVYDRSRTGHIWPMSFKLALLLMSGGSLDDKYRAIFNVIADEKGTVDILVLNFLLRDIFLIPKQLGEAAAFGETNIDATVSSCFEKVNYGVGIDLSHFVDWMKLEPQSLVWISVMQRLAETEQMSHQATCSVCKTNPIIGLRYRCLRCFSFDMCQGCFFLGRSTDKGHNLTHPMQEYATATTSGEDIRDISKVLKNKFRSQQSHKKHPRLGYLPVQSATNLAAKESQVSASQQTSNSTSTLQVHSLLEIYASRLAELEKRKPGLSECEDEHELIGQLCHSLGGGSNRSFQLQSPMQIMMALDSDQKSELDTVMKDLEEENRALQAEYDLMRQESKSLASRSIYDNYTDEAQDAESQNPDVEMMAEAKLLRVYKERLETRMEILEDHNSRLNSQLQRLRQLLPDQSDSPPNNSIVYPLEQTMTAPATSSATSQNSLPRKGPPSFSSRHIHQSLKEQSPTNERDVESSNNSVNGTHQRLDSESNENGEAFDVANVGRALDRLIEGITSYVDPTAKEEVL